MKHTCPRCGYHTDFGTNFKKHLNLKTLCPPLIEDISLYEIKSEYFGKKENNQNVCNYCRKK